MSKKTIKAIIIILCLWIAISCIIQAIKQPEMTQTEIFLRIPKLIIGDYK
jgi:hypothetical protein